MAHNVGKSAWLEAYDGHLAQTSDHLSEEAGLSIGTLLLPGETKRGHDPAREVLGIIAHNLSKTGFSAVLPAPRGKNFLFCESLEVQRKQTRRFIELSAMKVNPLLLLVIPLLFLSGPFVNAGPVGDFFKNVGQSISKPFQREPQPQPQPPQPQPEATRPQPMKTPHPTRRPTSRAAPAAAATPPAVGQRSQPAKEEEFTGTVRGVSAADIEKAKAGLPYGIPVPGRKGMVTSPYTPEQGKYVDVTGFASGSIAKDPYTGKLFLVP